ncbi:MAG: DUF5777 family beta-barrel protein [Bacteroidota bacterium]|nr:DUF5777 family beta-barrel protein [Bacteroidota bacterium]
MHLRVFLAMSLWCSFGVLNAQDLDQLLNDATQNATQTDYTTATFKSTRIINGHSIERMPARQLDFRISHRFGRVNTGSYNFYGLDESLVHLGFDYGITNWLMVGVGRGSYQKTFDGLLKFSILRQSKGKKNMPVSLSYFTSMAVNTLRDPNIQYFWLRMSYVHQILVARKFNERFSLEINPTFVHRNLVGTEIDPNDIFSVGIGGRFKITKRLAVNAEYYYVIPPANNFPSQPVYNPLSVGIDIDTGGHVFQIFLTNSEAMIEKGFIGETTGRWSKGDIRIGFNISRVFSFSKQK